MNENQNEKSQLIYSLKIDAEKRAIKSKPWTKRRKLLLVSALLLAVAAIILIPQLFKTPKVEVARAEVVREGLPATTLTAGGYVVADSTILVSSQINGKIKKIFVDEGDLVKKGDQLAEIEDDDYRAKYELAKADFNLAQATFGRKNNLYRQGVISKAEYDEALRVFRVQEAALKSAEYFFENTKVRAPIDGTIVKKEKEPGEFLLPGITSEGVPGSAVMKIADLRVMNVELDILESDLSKLKLDQPAAVFPDALPEKTYKAKLFYIAPQADRQKSIVEVKVRIESPDARLKPEMSARVYFLEKEATGTITQAIWVPKTALFKKDGKDYLYIVKQEHLLEKQVETGSEKEGKVSISSGLEGDESVVVKPRRFFKTSMKVEVQ